MAREAVAAGEKISPRTRFCLQGGCILSWQPNLLRRRPLTDWTSLLSSASAAAPPDSSGLFPAAVVEAAARAASDRDWASTFSCSLRTVSDRACWEGEGVRRTCPAQKEATPTSSVLWIPSWILRLCSFVR